MERRSRATINEELGDLEERIQTLRLREAEIQAIIESTYRLKDAVTKERLALQAKGLELQAEREPINWLPPELLIQIFIAFCALDAAENTQRAPIILSHVCRKWRNITINTPHVWSRVLMQTFTETDLLKTQLARSGTVPLEVAYKSARRTMPNAEVHQVSNLIHRMKGHLPRVERFALQCNNAMPFVYLLPVLKGHIVRLPLLQDLTLAVGTPNPTFLEAMNLVNARWPEEDAEANAASYTSPLRRLKLEQMPIFTVPKLFVANLHTLELCFPESRSPARHQYRLKMSALGEFLNATPLLEELVLNDTLPIFDTILPVPKPTDTPTGAAPADAPAPAAPATTWVEMAPVTLHNLKSLDWNFATTSAVHEFFAFIHTPSLERLDLWIERSSYTPNGTPRDINYVRGGQLVQPWPLADANAPPSTAFVNARPPAHRGAVHFPCLRELDLQYPGEDTLASVLRRFRLPSLERAAFTEVETDPATVLVSAVVQDMAAQTGRAWDPSLPRAQGVLGRRSRASTSRSNSTGSSTTSTSTNTNSASTTPDASSSRAADDQTHTFPRLEAILFDPRLTHLTHLTLSHQRIARDTQRVEAMLGYMPVLTSLSLDACTGVKWLLDGLAEVMLENGGRPIIPLHTHTHSHTQSSGEGSTKEKEKENVHRVRRGVKACPRLEALSFWNCPDVDFASIRSVVMARNKQAGELVDVGVGAPAAARPGAHSSGNAAAGSSASGAASTSHGAGAAPEAVGMAAGRKIKPLRKPRAGLVPPSSVTSGGLPVSGAGAPVNVAAASTNIVSKMIAIEESFRPAHIIYLRVSNCVLIDEDDLMALRDLDVVDVLWAGSE